MFRSFVSWLFSSRHSFMIPHITSPPTMPACLWILLNTFVSHFLHKIKWKSLIPRRRSYNLFIFDPNRQIPALLLAYKTCFCWRFYISSLKKCNSCLALRFFFLPSQSHEQSIILFASIEEKYEREFKPWTKLTSFFSLAPG